MIEKRIVPKTNKFATLIKDPDKFEEKNNSSVRNVIVFTQIM
jgi:hypothetical protein